MKRSIVGVLLATLGVVGSAQADLYKFVVPLEGAQEVLPNVGDPDGSGTAILFIDSDLLSIDWNIFVQDIVLPPTGAHIHQGVAGANGPVRVDFSSQLSGSGLVDADLASVLANPSGWYVNIHNVDHRGGAIRGQLGPGELVPESSTVIAGLAVCGLGAGAWLRRRCHAGVSPQ